MQVMVASWSEVLADIPTESLNDFYLIAIRNHSSSFPMGVGEIATAYRESLPDRRGDAASCRQVMTAPPEYLDARAAYRAKVLADFSRKAITGDSNQEIPGNAAILNGSRFA